MPSARDHDVGRGARAVGEGEGGLLVILLEADAPVAGMDDRRRASRSDEHGQQVGAVHAVELDPAGQLGGPHRRGVGAVRAAELRIDPSGAEAGQLVAEAEAPQHAHAVRLDGDAGADLGQGRGLLVETDVHAALEQGVGGGDAADAAADDRDAERVVAHGKLTSMHAEAPHQRRHSPSDLTGRRARLGAIAFAFRHLSRAL